MVGSSRLIHLVASNIENLAFNCYIALCTVYTWLYISSKLEFMDIMMVPLAADSSERGIGVSFGGFRTTGVFGSNLPAISWKFGLSNES